MENSVDNVHVRIDHKNIRNQALCVSSVVFGMGFLICLIVGAVGPSVFQQKDGPIQQIVLPADGAVRWIEEIDYMVRSHRILWMTFSFQRPGWNEAGVGKDFDVKYDQEVELVLKAYHQSDGDEIVLSDAVKYTREVSCLAGEEWCEEMLLFFEPYVKYPIYIATATLYDPAKIETEGSTEVSMISHIYHMDADYTSFEVVWSYVFLSITILVMFCPVLGFFWRMFRLPYGLWSTQQKWISALLAMLFFFNNPFLAAEVKYASSALGDFYIVCAVTFVCTLLLYWLCLLKNIRKESYGKMSQVPQQEGQQAVSKLKDPACWLFFAKFVLCLFLWAVLVSGYLVMRRMESIDPAYNGVSELNSVNEPFVILLSILMVFYIFWIARSVFVCLPHIMEMPPQYLFLLSITFCAVVIAIVGIFAAFFYPIRTYAIEYTSCAGMFNLYIWILGISYTPYGHDAYVKQNEEIECIEFVDDFVASDQAKNDEESEDAFGAPRHRRI